MNEPKSHKSLSLEPDESGPAPAPETPASEAAPKKEAGDSSKVAALEAELAKTKDQMLRALAEAENGRKRALKERDDASKYSVAVFAKDMLNVADNLRRALNSIPPELVNVDPRLKNVVEGIEATERELLKSFEKAGIRKIDPVDEIFNPNFHEVMFEAAVPGKPAGSVIQVIDVGYILHDRLLRPARVGVAKAGDDRPGGQIDTQA